MSGPAWSWRGVRKAALVAAVALAVGAALGYAVSHERVPQPGSKPEAARPR